MTVVNKPYVSLKPLESPEYSDSVCTAEEQAISFKVDSLNKLEKFYYGQVDRTKKLKWELFADTIQHDGSDASFFYWYDPLSKSVKFIGESVEDSEGNAFISQAFFRGDSIFKLIILYSDRIKQKSFCCTKAFYLKDTVIRIGPSSYIQFADQKKKYLKDTALTNFPNASKW